MITECRKGKKAAVSNFALETAVFSWEREKKQKLYTRPAQRKTPVDYD